MNRILVLHGPNLNLLGIREPDLYGQLSLNQLNQHLERIAQNANIILETFQSNHEGELIEAIHRGYRDKISYIIFNPAALTHTSVALRDALSSVAIPFIEVHLSNIYARESFRTNSYFSDIAKGVISGFGVAGYECALQCIINEFNLREL